MRALKPLISLFGSVNYLGTVYFLGTALLMALLPLGCSSPTSSKGKSACTCERQGGGVKGQTAQDSLVKSAKASGKGAVSGSLTGESKSVADGLLKMGVNAAGERRYLTFTQTPLEGATILIFDALRPTTAAETTITTDKKGNYAALLKPGKYYGFAVHLDLATFRLITAAIPFINPVKDTIVKMDTAVAIEDNNGPTITGVFDATSPDASGIFRVGDIPATGARINVVFSEPMQREGAKGMLIGKVDTGNVNGSLVLKDTLPASAVAATWSGDSKQITLALGGLQAGSRYGLIIPTMLRDLAKNPLEKEYRATFLVVPENQVAGLAFSVASTFPVDGDSLKPSQNPSLTFTRPPQVFSALSSIVITPKLEGNWEANGARLTFVHKAPLLVGATYTILVPDTLIDLGGKPLGKTFRMTFSVKEYEGAAKEKTGRDQAVALLMEDFFNARLQGDVGRMAGLLTTTFRMETEGQFLSPQQFLDRIRREAAEKSALNAGFLGPVYKVGAGLCSTRVSLWKVASTDKADTLWVQTRTSPGNLPKVFRGNQEVTSGLAWSKTEPRLTLGGKTYLYDLPASNLAESAPSDFRLQGERLRLHTTAVLGNVQDAAKEEFTIDGGITVTEQKAKVAVKLSTITTRTRSDWDAALACADMPRIDTTYRIVKFFLGFNGNKWLVTHAVDEGEVGRQKFVASVSAADFKARVILPITLVAPVNNKDGASASDGRIAFRFKGLDLDSLGGYLVGLAEDPKFIGGRASFGGLYFVRSQGKGTEQVFELGANGQPLSGANAIVRDVQTLLLPGWERTNFKYPLTELFNPDKGLSGVYQWKVIAIRDTSAAQFLQNGFAVERFFGESDFGTERGAFAAKGYPSALDFNRIEQGNQVTPGSLPTAAALTDRDLDGFPDALESNYRTNPDEKGSFPNFAVDTDRDRLADFLEVLIDTTGASVEKEATAEEKKTFFAALALKKVKWIDGDGDGFPDDVEQILGYNPLDSLSHPATRARVPAPTGFYAGLIKLGDNAYALKFKVREQEGKLLVSYAAYFKDTLNDTVRANLNETMGEFLFPVRLPNNGPDSGKSLLLRGTYDKNRAFLSGPANRIVSVPRTSEDFGGGPFVGQYAASGRGEDVAAYLGVTKAGTTPDSIAAGGGAISIPAVVLSYRKPPLGQGAQARFTLRQNGARLYRLVMQDDFGDTVATLDSALSYPQENGSFDLDARMVRFQSATLTTRRVEVHARLGRGKDSLTDIWVLDGSLTSILDSCRVIDPVTKKCTDKFYREIPGQFSSKVAANHVSVKAFANGVAGDFQGWLQQDKFGTGLVDGSTGGSSAGTGNPGTIQVNPVPPQSFSKPFTGGSVKFRPFLSQAGIAPDGVFYVSLFGRVMRTVYDTLSVRDAEFPYCSNVKIKAVPIPLLDGATAAEKEAFKRDSTWVSSGKYGVLAMEDDASPGTPAKVAKARDALGFVRTDVFLIEARYVDPASLVGGKCLDGGIIPPLLPIDAGLPPLPAGTGYFRGTLETLRAALTAAGNKITVLKAGSELTQAVDINPATLRLDPETKAGMAQNADDPAVGYVFLTATGQPTTPKLVDARPAAATK